MSNYGYDKFIVCTDCGASHTGTHECYPVPDIAELDDDPRALNDLKSQLPTGNPTDPRADT
jgi:hypothetical protein